jgi:hypothetical protein
VSPEPLSGWHLTPVKLQCLHLKLGCHIQIKRAEVVICCRFGVGTPLSRTSPEINCSINVIGRENIHHATTPNWAMGCARQQIPIVGRHRHKRRGLIKKKPGTLQGRTGLWKLKGQTVFARGQTLSESLRTGVVATSPVCNDITQQYRLGFGRKVGPLSFKKFKARFGDHGKLLRTYSNTMLGRSPIKLTRPGWKTENAIHRQSAARVVANAEPSLGKRMRGLIPNSAPNPCSSAYRLGSRRTAR